MFKVVITTKPRFLGLVESRTLTIEGFKTYKEAVQASKTLKDDKKIKEIKISC